MRTITVDKVELLRVLETNLNEHREIFIKAQVAYREKMIAELDRALAEAREGGTIRRMFSLPVPEDHTEDFATAIKMLAWHQFEQIELTMDEFETYVENKWRWRASFTANTESYLNPEPDRV
jgi:hypothetical protein